MSFALLLVFSCLFVSENFVKGTYQNTICLERGPGKGWGQGKKDKGEKKVK